MVAAVVAAGAVFRGEGSVPPVFAALVLLVWIALRLGTVGVGVAGAGISCLIAAAVASGGVPFAGAAGPSSTAWIYLKLGLGFVIFVMLLLAVEIREREAALSAAETAGLRAVQATERLELLGREQDARLRAERAQQRLTVLARASAALAGADEEDDLLAGLTDVLVRHVCDRASVLLPGEHGALSRAYVLTATASDAPGTARRVQPTPSERDLADPRHAAWTTLTTTLEDDPEQLAGYLVEAGAGEPAFSGRDLPVGLLCAPVVARGLPIGVLALWRFAGRPVFVDEDVELADDLGHRLGTALDALRTLAEHRRIAQRLQSALLPGELPVVAGVELAARYVAADRHAEVGGDFYDAVAVAPGRLVLAIGDVAGRGVDAAAVTGLARATLRAVAGQLSPVEALTRLNAVLLQRAEVGERFLTAAHAWLRVDADGGGEVQVALGGHPPPLLLTRSGEVRPLGTAGTLLGAFADIEIASVRLSMELGDTIVFYTDGVIEARGETGLLGEEGLAAVLSGCAGRSADEVAGRLMDAVTTFAAAAAADDVAVLVARLSGAQEEGSGLVTTSSATSSVS
jgi:serine phosphatase RsbU (regulator of sigma subunit)